MTPMSRLAWLLLISVPLSGCDQLSERAGFANPAKVEAEGKAIGGACRHAGRGLEDCYRLNKNASKPAIFAGWKEMNEYMVKNNMQAVEPTIAVDLIKLPKKGLADEHAAEDKSKDKADAHKSDEPREAAANKAAAQKKDAEPSKENSGKH